MKPSNKVLADRLKRDEWGQKMYRPNGGEFVTSHKHGVVGEAYDEMLDGLNYLYRAQSERALAARSLVHLAADLLAAEIMELEALGTTIDERNRMELTADTETGKDQRIAALEAQLAKAQRVALDRGAQLLERGNELMALTTERDEWKAKAEALAAVNERLLRAAREMAGFVKPYGLDDYGPQSEYSRWVQCRNILDNEPDRSAILADFRGRERRAGYQSAVDVLDDLLLNCCLPPLGPDEGFRQALLRLITWEVQVALDPQVSLEACKLQRQGKIEALGELLLWGPNVAFGDYAQTRVVKEFRDEIRRRIAELEAQG